MRRPPGHAPQEPIIIKVPGRLPEAPEIDRSDDEEEEEAEIRRPPGIVPELPPPPRPESPCELDGSLASVVALCKRSDKCCHSFPMPWVRNVQEITGEVQEHPLAGGQRQAATDL